MALFGLTFRKEIGNTVSVARVEIDSVPKGGLRHIVRDLQTLLNNKTAEAQAHSKGCTLDGVDQCAPTQSCVNMGCPHSS